MPKRTATQASLLAESQEANKCYRSLLQTIDEVADEYVCSITFELPIDPVTAEDGRCYERCAIEEWLERQPQPQVKSPVTNEPMGKRLLPAVQLRNTLKRLVESGAISGSKADAWKAAMAEEAEVAALRAEAEGGDAVAMRRLGFAYRDGKRGLKKDRTQAFTWLKRAADQGNAFEMKSTRAIVKDSDFHAELKTSKLTPVNDGHSVKLGMVTQRGNFLQLMELDGLAMNRDDALLVVNEAKLSPSDKDIDDTEVKKWNLKNWLRDAAAQKAKFATQPAEVQGELFGEGEEGITWKIHLVC